MLICGRVKPLAENGYYAFNDMHAVIALVGAGRLAEARAILADLQKAAIDNPPLTAMMARDVGVPAAQAMIAFAERRYDDVVDALYPIRSIANRFGGSNAQRDILSQTLIDGGDSRRSCGAGDEPAQRT